MITADEVLAVAEPIARLSAGLPVEVTCVVPRTRGRWSDVVVVSIGQPDRVAARPQDIFRSVLTAGGDSFVLGHTHVSEAPPGEEDHAVTRRLVAASTVLGIPLLAHVVTGPERVWDCMSGGEWPWSEMTLPARDVRHGDTVPVDRRLEGDGMGTQASATV